MSTLHTLTMPINGISAVGKNVIEQELRTEIFLPLPPDWVWDFRVTGKGEYVGSFAKRVGKFYHNQGKKLSDELRAKIGTLAAANCDKVGQTYHFRFVNSFSWNQGDHGDPEACFFSCHSNGADVLDERDEFSAMLFYDSEGKGIGRALLWDTGKATLVWNTYGFGDHCVSGGNLVAARILAHFRNHAYYRRIEMQNGGENHGEIWINCGAYAVGNQEDVLALGNLYDIHLSCGGMCYECEDTVLEEDLIMGPDDNPYCNSCYHDIWLSCEQCGEVVSNDDAYCGNDYMYCEDCHTELFGYCDKCGETTDRDELKEGVNSDYYCECCWDEKFVCCEQCGETLTQNDSMIGADDEPYCQEHWTERFFQCEKCGEMLELEERKEGDNGEEVCGDCGGNETIFPRTNATATQTLFPVGTIDTSN